MPQLDPLNFSSQLVWLAISFVVLYLFLARVALPRIANVIEQRQDRVSRDLDEAEKLKTETENAIVAYEQSMAEARSKAHAIAQETRDKLNAEVEDKRISVESKLSEKMAEAENRIMAAKEAALTQINEVASDTAGALVEALIGKKIPGAEIEKAVQNEIGK